MKPKSSISRSPKGSYQLKIEGHFSHPHWIAFLFSGLASQKISVLSGTGRRTVTNDWDARFDLDFRGSTAVPERVDYLGLIEQKKTVENAAPVLSKFQLDRRSDQALELRIQGPDQIGFLGRLLYKVSVLGLFPMELEIDTVANQIQDRIVFQGIGGLTPSDNVQKLLDSMLASWSKSA